jgi:transcriptional regulator with XRE-family HTH domain
VDVVLKLRELRRTHGLSQKDVARRSGIGEKTLSSFETGARIGALKLAQLERLIAVYGLDLAAFFNPALDAELSGAPPPAVEHLRRIVEPLLADGRSFNALLVSRGYAQPLTIPPNDDYADLFVRLTRRARERGRGLWGDPSCYS